MFKTTVNDGTEQLWLQQKVSETRTVDCDISLLGFLWLDGFLGVNLLDCLFLFKIQECFFFGLLFSGGHYFDVDVTWFVVFCCVQGLYFL